MEHDRQLQVEGFAERAAARLRRGGAEVVRGGVDQRLQLLPEHVHRAEHVVLRQGDADVVAADAGAVLVVRLVPGAGEQRVQPVLERDLEVPDLALTGE